jgi:hypothetical protein
VIAEAPYLFSVAGLSVSLAGFAGLVAAFRQGAGPRPIDIFRLRQIAEFGFANAILSLLPIPLAASAGDPATAFRLASGAVLVYVLVYMLVLLRAGRGLGLPYRTDPLPLVIALNVGIVSAAAFGAATSATAAFEWALLLLLVRPMLAFVLVLVERGSGR